MQAVDLAVDHIFLEDRPDFFNEAYNVDKRPRFNIGSRSHCMLARAYELDPRITRFAVCDCVTS